MTSIDLLIGEAIAAGQIPGAVIEVGTSSGIVFQQVYGNRSCHSTIEPMTIDTIFDLASLTKPMACASAIMLLADRSQLLVTERISKFIPSFGINGKDDITIEQLLLHTSGLAATNPLADYFSGRDHAISAISKSASAAAPGTAFCYSDLGYIVLGVLPGIIDGRPLDQFVRDEIFLPLRMQDAGFNPARSLWPRCAPTRTDEGDTRRGQVHDPRAALLGGVGGHAGLFGTLGDVATYCRMILRLGSSDERRVFSEAMVASMTAKRGLPENAGCRSYAFDIDTSFSAARGVRFAKETTFGHTGFTGTMLWIDPSHDCFVVLLTNAIYMADRSAALALRELRSAVSTAAAEMIFGGRI